MQSPFNPSTNVGAIKLLSARDLPETNASQVIRPEAGGKVALKDGAEISIRATVLPPQP